MISQCIYCGKECNDSLHGNYVVKQAVRPKGSPYRYVTVGYACDNCVDVQRKPVLIDDWKGKVSC